MPILDMAQALLATELARNPDQFRAAKPPIVDLGLGEGSEMTPLPIRTAGILGGLADAASTYYFLKTGRGREDNALYKPLKNHPAATAAAVFGATQATRGALALMRKFAPRVADAAEANLAATQMMYAGVNGRHAPGDSGHEASLRKWVVAADQRQER